MLLHRIHLDLRNRQARRDLADPYQLHATLCRAICCTEVKCPENEFLWRLEPETDAAGCPRILVQTRSMPDWKAIGIDDWLASVDPPVDLVERLKLDEIRPGQRYRFRLRANPCVTRNGKRLGLLHLPEQEQWLARKSGLHGFNLPSLTSFDFSDAVERCDVRISQQRMLSGRQHNGNAIRVFSALFDGELTVVEPNAFRRALQVGIGHGKAMGLGLLSVVPLR